MQEKRNRMTKRTRASRPVTSVDVARFVGVSQSVVSRAFSLDTSVAPETRAKIFAAAEKLGYRRNLLARSLITQRSNLIALVTGAFTNPLHLSLVAATTRVAQARGYRVLLFATPPGETLDHALGEVLQHRPDGVVALAGTPSETLVSDCRRDGIPIVLIGRDSESPTTSSVSCDNEGEGRQIGELLLKAGHRRFAFVASRGRTLSFSRDRERGFSDTILARSGKTPAVENGDSTYEGGYAAGKRLLRDKTRPDAVFCAGDVMALGLMDAARHELGLRIPDDLSVVGFDDVPMASWVSYRLTTVRQRVDVMVEAAVDILLDPGAPDAAAVWRHVPGDLILRCSARLEGGLAQQTSGT
jgi:DNA-binding LacI/PurR family transcriptional regulator